MVVNTEQLTRKFTRLQLRAIWKELRIHVFPLSINHIDVNKQFQCVSELDYETFALIQLHNLSSHGPKKTSPTHHNIPIEEIDFNLQDSDQKKSSNMIRRHLRRKKEKLVTSTILPELTLAEVKIYLSWIRQQKNGIDNNYIIPRLNMTIGRFALYYLIEEKRTRYKRNSLNFPTQKST